METADVPSAEEVSNRRELWALGLFAVLIRLLVILTTSHVYHVSVGRLSWQADGMSYLAMAKGILGDSSLLHEYERRVFPGYPLLIALGHLAGLPWSASSMGVSWACAGIAAVLAALLCRDNRVGWAMTILTPHYLLYSSMSLTEPVLAAFCLAGLYFAVRRRQPVIGGLLLGYAGIVRPFACFAVAGYLFYALLKRQWREGALVACASAALVGLAANGMRILTGNVLSGVHVYQTNPEAYGRGELFTYPFRSLITTPMIMHISPLKIIYVWMYVVATLAAIVILALRWRKPANDPADQSHRDIAALFLPWIVGNTLTILCIGFVWGFLAFHRFSSWALAPMLYAFAPILPKRTSSWAALTIISFTIAVTCLLRN